MHATISILVSSMILGSLAFNRETLFTNPSRLSTSNSGTGLLFADSSKPSPNRPGEPPTYRGSGRKESINLQNYQRKLTGIMVVDIHSRQNSSNKQNT